MDSESKNIQGRLTCLYEVLETNNLNLDDLAPHITDLCARQEESWVSREQIAANTKIDEVKMVEHA